jgi:hypothetical protein
MFMMIVAVAVVGGYTYLRVGQVVRRRRALGHRPLPGHMPLLAGVAALIVASLIVGALPGLRAEPVLGLGLPLAVGFGVGGGVRSGMRQEVR